MDPRRPLYVTPIDKIRPIRPDTSPDAWTLTRPPVPPLRGTGTGGHDERERSILSIHPCPAPKCSDVDGNAVLTDQPMCAHHVGKVAQALADLPRLYDACTAALLPGQRGGSDDVRVSTSRIEAPVPIDLEPRAAQEDMLNLLREHLDIARGRCNERRLLVQLVAWARADLADLLAVDVEFGVEVLKIKHRIRAMLGLNRFVHRLVAPCPACHAPLLTREDGSELVICRSCGTAMTADAAMAAGIDVKIEAA